jgi:hypothetical protein
MEVLLAWAARGRQGYVADEANEADKADAY